jgi:3-oxoacyl-[acyl-carrier protein] reductase
MDLGLVGKRVLVAGASRGIGLAIARGFLQEGAMVTITARNCAQLETARMNLAQSFPAGNILSVCCDVASQDDIARLKNQITDEWKGLDIVVANAGNGRSIPDVISSREHFDLIFDQNFTVAVSVAREFLPVLEKSSGSILFIASIAGIEAFGAPVDYSVAKSAVLSFSKNIARKVAHKGVRVNCLAPGNILFDGGSWDEKIKEDSEKIGRLIDATVPMKRFGTPEEIADAALFISSERASFITGAVLCIDGGQTVSLF